MLDKVRCIRRIISFGICQRGKKVPDFFRVPNPVAYCTVSKVIGMPGVDDITADNDNSDDNEDNDNTSNITNWL